MTSKQVIGIVLLILAVVLFLGIGLGGGTMVAWLSGALVGAAFVLAGLFFYRRGK